jgi:quercetin dioxygenase-like cupin family protein
MMSASNKTRRKREPHRAAGAGDQAHLQGHDLSVPGREVTQNRVDISPEAPFVRRKHPGEEIIYVLEGSLEYRVEGRPPTTLEAGDVLLPD